MKIQNGVAAVNRQVRLASRPRGFPSESNFELVEEPVPRPAEGEFLVRTIFLSVDPYMRGRLRDAPSYVEPVRIGQVMEGECVGQVVRSLHRRFPEGTFVAGMFGWREFAISNGQNVRKVDPRAAPISTALHVLGMTGLTAFFGISDVCQVKPGETLVISGAAGAVGTTAGQLAKQRECRVVGIAGSDEKIRYLTEELGFDAAFNYKTTSDYALALSELCPDGVDAYFDNVGGPLTDAVIPRFNVGARMGVCGQISQYNAEQPEQGPRWLFQLIIKRATVQGFLVLDYLHRYAEGLRQLNALYQAGQLKYRERISQGIENAPRAFLEMMQGANIGKQLVQVAENAIPPND